MARPSDQPEEDGSVAGDTVTSSEDGSDRASLADKAKSWLRTASPTHALILSVLGSAGGGLALPQEIPVIREFACDWYFARHPAFSVMGSEERCQIPEIAKLAGEIVTSARILNALITVLGLTIYSDMLSRFGRKPMFAFVAFCLTCSIILFGLGAAIRGPLGIALIASNFVFSGLGSQPLLQLTFQSYIVDCVKTEERAPTFALLGSATFTGLALSSLASSALTTYTNIPLLPFWIGSAVFGSMFLYAVFVLPEALTPERQAELIDANQATQDSETQERQDEESHLHAFFKRFNFLKKLVILFPQKDSKTGKRDYRLSVLAIAFTIYRIAGLYTNDLLLLTTTGSFGFTGTENGLLVGFITASKALLLMGILPFAIRIGRSKYAAWSAHKASVQPSMDGHSESSRLLANHDRSYTSNEDDHSVGKAKPDEVPDGSERFDLYFGAASFMIDALALIGVGCSKAVWHLYASTALLSISAAGGPSVQSIATEVAAKALTDQVLSALALIDNAGAVLSPLVLGSIYSATARTIPRLAWFVSAGLFVIAAIVLLCMPSSKMHVQHTKRRTKKKRNRITA